MINTKQKPLAIQQHTGNLSLEIAHWQISLFEQPVEMGFGMQPQMYLKRPLSGCPNHLPSEVAKKKPPALSRVREQWNSARRTFKGMAMRQEGWAG